MPFKWFNSLLAALYSNDPVYVMRFRKELSDIAGTKLMHQEGYPFARVWFIRWLARAEIRTWFGFGRLVAVVRVHGSESSPYEMVITFLEPPPVTVQFLFEKSLPNLRVSFDVAWGNPQPVAGSWGVSDKDFYVARFEKDLIDVAKSLNGNIRARFNRSEKCAELYDDWGAIVRIWVNGSECVASSAVIVSPRPLPDGTKTLLKKALSSLQVSFKEQAQPA